MAADYQVSVSELPEEASGEGKLPQRPQYSVADTDYELQTYLDYLNMGRVWNSYTGSGVTVAVIDTGIDTDHPEFAGRISEYSYNATEDKIVRDYDDWSLIEDEQGHGTAVAGVIAASMDGYGTVGIAPDAQILVIKAECDEYGNFCRVSDLVYGLYYAIERDANVVNMSFGTSGLVNPFAEATKLAYDSDIVCVAAAGNSATSALTWPAADENVIGVGALDGWMLEEMSNYGENVTVCAPGTTYTTAMGGGYGTASGTSQASAIVTGAIALRLQWAKYATVDQTRQQLYVSSCDLGQPGRDWYYGFGALDIGAMILESQGIIHYDMLTDELDDLEGIYIQGHTLQELPQPERLYAVFDGWYYDDTYTQECNYYVDKFYTEEITLYAKWINEDDGLPYTYWILDDGTVEITGYTGHRRYIVIPEKIEGRIVSSIGDFAFYGQNNLREITLPSGLRHIGESAFEDCANLISMQIPENVTEIEHGAFRGNVRLSSVAFPGSSKLVSIGEYAFAGCGNLQRIELPALLEKITGSTFSRATALYHIGVQQGNTALQSIDGVLFNSSGDTLIAFPAAWGTSYTLPEQTTRIGEMAFAFAKLEQIDLENITSIEESAFMFAKLESLMLPDSLTQLGASAFSNNEQLTQVTFGRGLTQLPEGVFSGARALRQIELPAWITSIGDAAFEYSGLRSVLFAENSTLQLIGKRAFAICAICEIRFPSSVQVIDAKAFMSNPLSSMEFAAESNLHTIGEGAFASTTTLENVALPQSLRIIGDKAFYQSGLTAITIPANVEYLGAGAFALCKHLEAIAVEEGNAHYHALDGVVYDLENVTLCAYPAGSKNRYYSLEETTRFILPWSFAGAEKLEDVVLPEGMTVLGEYSLTMSGIYSVTLPQSLTQIQDQAFADCGNLTKVKIPDNVAQMGEYVFSNCWKLQEITFGRNSQIQRIGMHTFAYCGITSFAVPANVSSIAQYAFEGCRKLSSISFQENSKVENITAYLFDGCDALKYVYFDSGSALKHIQAHAFEGLKNLEYVGIHPDVQLKEIDNFAFRCCTKLEYVGSRDALPQTLESIGRYAFFGCKSLQDLLLPESVEHVGGYAFLGCEDLDVFFAAEQIPAYLEENWDFGIRGYYMGVVSVEETERYQYARLTSGGIAIIDYLGNDTLVDLTQTGLDAPITQIGGYAFRDSTVKTIVLPDTLTSIQAEAFAYSPLMAVQIPANVTFIGRAAFAYTALASLTFAQDAKITTIEQYAFRGTKDLTSVEIPASVNALGTGVFMESGLQSVSFAADIQLANIPQKAFAQTKLTEVILPNSVTVVDHNAFQNVQTLKKVRFGENGGIRLMSNAFYHTGLESLDIPANVTYIGEYCFAALPNLENFTVAADNPNYKAVDGVLMSKDGRTLIAMPAGKTGSYLVPASVEIIGTGAFEDSALSEVLFHPDTNLLSISCRAFLDAGNLKAITIPASVVSIDYYAFAYCEQLQQVAFAEGSRLKGIYEGAFAGCGALAEMELPDTVKEISDFAFYGCRSLEKIPVSETTLLQGIYDYAFAYSGIRGVLTIPETVADIGSYVFLETRITHLIVPDARQRELSIGYAAFMACNRLEEITLPFVGRMYEDEETGFGYYFGSIGTPESLKTVTLTEGVSVLYPGAFTGLNCEQLHLPHSVIEVHGGALAGVTATFQLTNTILLQEDASFAGSALSGHLTLSEQTKEIGKEVFQRCRQLEGITLPEGLYAIGESAFEDCVALKTINLPNSLGQLGNGSFSGCDSLTEIHIPQQITEIPQNAFAGCDSLTQVTLPEGLAEISYYAFADCEALEEIQLPDHLQTIRSGAFEECGLTQIVIPEGITMIESDTFYRCYKLLRVTLPDSLQTISYSAFSQCVSLTHITIPANVTTIEGYAFSDCIALSSVHNLSDLDITLGDANHGYVALHAKRLTDAAGNCFYYTDDFENLQCLETEDGFLFQIYDGAYTLKAYLGDAQTVTLPLTVMGQPYDISQFRGGQHVILPEGFTSVPDYAFWGSEGLQSITLPQSMISIGYYAFEGCWHLQEIVIPDNVTSIEDYAFQGCIDLRSVRLPENLQMLGAHAFDACYSLQNVELPEGLTAIGDSAFAGCGQLFQLQLPKNLQTIGTNAFASCSELKTVTFPESLTIIGERAFDGCNGLSQITIPQNVSEVGDSVFAGCSALRSVTICGDSTRFGSGVFTGCAEDITFELLGRAVCIVDGLLYTGDMTQLLHVPSTVSGHLALPNTLQSIGAGLFENCVGLQSVVIPDSVAEIGDHAFAGCANLAAVEMGSGVKTIGQSAFADCTNLTEVQIGEGVQTIGSLAFQNCTGLETVHIGAGVQYISLQYGVLGPVSPFAGCESLSYISVHEDNQYYACVDGMLYDMTYGLLMAVPRQLKGEVTLPEGLRYLNANTFEHCERITGITLPASVVSVSDRAFVDCTGLRYIQVAEDNPIYFACNGVLYEKDPLRILYVPMGIEGHLVLAEGLESIDYHFRGCHALTGVTIPASVCRVTPGYYNVFAECPMLETILVSEGNSCFFVQDNIWYSASPVEIISLPGVLQSSIVLPEGLTEIRNDQFEGEKTLVSITLPSTLTNIGWDAFGGCAHLYEVINHSQLPITGPWGSDYGGIGWYAKVVVDASNPEDMGLVQIKQTEDGFLYVSYRREYWLIAYVGKEETVTLPEDLEGCTYHIDAFHGGKHIIIPGTVTSIADSAFAENHTLESVVIQEGVTYLGAFAFSFCSNLQQVSIPGSVELIYPHTFQHCAKLTQITLHEGLRAIGTGALDDTALTQLSLPSTLTYIASNALPTLSLGTQDAYWKNGVLTIDGWILDVREDVSYIPDIASYRGASADAYAGCVRLKTILWGGGGCQSAETVLVRHMDDFGVEDQWRSSASAEYVKNVVILEDIDLVEFLEDPYFFLRFEGVCIFVERSEEMARYNDNFPGWNGNMRVVYGGNWTWANFYDQEGQLLSSTPRRNAEVILRPPMEDYLVDEMVYVFSGWDVDGDGMVDNLPATMITDLNAYPVYTPMSFCQAYGHQLVYTEGKAATCTEHGWTAYETCENCDHSTYEQIPALGHSFADGVCQHCGAHEAQSGDVNGDGRINARDARALLRYLAGLTEEGEIDLTAADYNGDGKINARDARAILRFIAGLE